STAPTPMARTPGPPSIPREGTCASATITIAPTIRSDTPSAVMSQMVRLLTRRLRHLRPGGQRSGSELDQVDARLERHRGRIDPQVVKRRVLDVDPVELL